MESKIYPYPKWERRLDNGNVGDHADWFQDVADIQTHTLKIVLQGIFPSDDKNKYENFCSKDCLKIYCHQTYKRLGSKAFGLAKDLVEEIRNV